MGRLTLALLLALLATPGLPADVPVEIHTAVAPDTVTIGSRFRFTVTVTAPPDVEVLLGEATDRIGDFAIVDYGAEPPETREGRTVITRWYELVGWSPGHFLLEPPPVQYRAPGEALTDAPAPEARVSIESLLDARPEVTEIRDIKGPEPFPRDWRPWLVLGGGALGLAALTLLLFRLLNQRRRAPAGPPPRPAHEEALSRLEILRHRQLLEAGDVKGYWTELTAVVRTYLERRFGLRAPEMTTEEFLLVTARDGRLQPSQRRLLGTFLAESDLVKFAQHRPTVSDGERAWEAARHFVVETAAAPGEEASRAAG